MSEKIAVQIMSEIEMLGFLKTNGTSCRFVGLLTKTPVVKIKAGNPWNAGKDTERGLYKVSRKGGIINANYNTSVRRRIAEKLGVELGEVEYESGKSAYVHLKTADDKPLPVLVKASNPNDGVYYLQYFPHHARSFYVDEEGNRVPDELVKPWLYKESERPDFKPTVIAPKLANIKELRASGVILENPDLNEINALIAD